MLNKEEIVSLLATNDRAVARALLVLNERQTADEQISQNTRHRNGYGFRPCHARMGTSMAKFFQRTGYLTAKQVAYWRANDRSGNMRIGIYWSQLAEAAEAKAAAKAAQADRFRDIRDGEDLGNYMEEKMIWDEMAAEREMQRLEVA